MCRTLYVSDLDGTLLGPDSRISERSAAIISELSDRGAMITVATARTPATVVPLMSQTRTTPPAVVMTGCAYWMRGDGCFRDPHFLPGDDVKKALEFCGLHGVQPFVYLMSDDRRSLDVYHLSPHLNKAEESYYLERSDLILKRFHLGVPAPQRAATHTMLLYAMGEEDGICAAAEAFKTTTECSVCCYPDVFNPRVWNFEVFPPGISKASAVLNLKKELGADRLVVFGDSLNDLPMLAVADVAVAVGNALPEVKAAAHKIIEPNDTDSVARFISADLHETGLTCA